MNDPYPTAAQLRIEARADRLLDNQEASAIRFQAMVRRMIAFTEALDLPLGSPCAEYDLDGILGTMRDWLAPRDPLRLQDAAFDAARDQVESPA
jgi:hypothetical protein